MKILFVAKDSMLSFSVKESVKERMPNKENEFEYCDLADSEFILIGFMPDIVVLCYYYNESLTEREKDYIEKIKENSLFIENDFSRYLLFKNHRLDISFQETEQVLYKLKIRTRAIE